MTLTIHPTAIVSHSVELADDITIGPYCVLDGDVSIGTGTQLISHVCVSGRTSIGKRCTIHPFASLGQPPQDLRYCGEQSSLIIGDDNIIREYVTMNPGTAGGGLVTRVGSHCLFMAGAHVAHDCKVGSHVILANHVALGGHVEVGDHAIIGANSVVQQLVRIGRHALIGALAGVRHSIIPYGMALGFGVALDGLHVVGLRRRGFARGAIHALSRVFARIFQESEGTLAERMQQVLTESDVWPEVLELVRFIAENDEIGCGICKPRPAARGSLSVTTVAAS